jgi:hypothetical protein
VGFQFAEVGLLIEAFERTRSLILHIERTPTFSCSIETGFISIGWIVLSAGVVGIEFYSEVNVLVAKSELPFDTSNKELQNLQ